MRTHSSLVRPALAGFVLLASAMATPVTAHAQCTSNPNGLRCFGTDLSPNPASLTTPIPTNATAARAAFFASLVGVGTESFETLSGSSPFLLSFPGAGTATLTGGDAEIRSVAGSGRYPSAGANFLNATSSANNAATFGITFGSTVAAFGFFGSDIGDFGSQLTLRFTLANGLGTVNWTLPYTASNGSGTARDASGLYAGFIDTRGFTAVQFLGTDADDSFGFDEMSIGSLQQVQITTTPEPSTVVLLAAGMTALLVTARRRRHA